MKTLYNYIIWFLMVVSLKSHSQVIFTELKPTIKIPDVYSANIDFNSDGIANLMILYNGYKSNPGCPATFYFRIGFKATSDTLIIIENATGGIVFNNLDFIQDRPFKICVADNSSYPCTYFVESTYGCEGGANYSGLRKAVNNQYFAVKFKINNKYHYGWIKFSKTDGINVEIKSFAYNTEPNKTFRINDPFSTSLQKELNEDKIWIYPNPFKDEIKISYHEAKIINISIYNLLGQIIYSENNISNEAVINSAFIPKGTYIVKLNTGEKILSTLIIK